MDNKLFKIEKALISGFLIAVVFSSLAFFSNCYSINKNVIRMHIIANSDSDFDQSVKLCIRDAVAKETENMLQDASCKKEAMDILKENLKSIEDCATKAARENGSEDLVRAEIISGYFPTREYENGTLPAGIYDSVRVYIGEGEGKNWWCVVFPSLCVSAAEKNNTLNEQENEIIENGNTKYKIGFKIIEIFEGIREFFRER